MNTISQAYVNALLADATYVNLVQGMSEADLKRDLEVRMTPTQAAYIAANFEVASSINSSDIALFGSGFDATVWRGRAGGEFAGQVFVSARGTEPEAGGADLLADGDLALQVGARSQIIDMVNWWLRESTPIDQQARQIKWDTLRQPDPLSLQIVPGFVDAAPVAGTGGAVGISSVQINGHSLGGHMASAFARIFGGNTGQTSSVNVQAISTFNSAGFNGNNAEAIFQSIQSLLGSGTSSFESVSAKQTNYFAQNGINVTTNTWWFTQMGKRTALFQEESTGLSNHSMYKLTDLLALGAALEKLDSTMNLDRLNNLLKAGSNQPVASLEGLLDSLRKMTQGSRAATTPVGDGEGSAPSRQDFHINLKALTDSPIFVALAGKVTLSLPDSTLATKAKTDFAAFLSLNALSPVVISTSDAASITALKAANPALSIAWTADKNARLYGDTTKAFDYTDNWYEDRTALLQNLTIANTKDALANPDGYLAVQGTPSGDTNTRYIDLATSKLLQVNNARISPSTAFNKYVMFGDDTANTMNGGSQADSLYGGAGDDTLDGKAGADYLEGGTGDDKLDGGKDSDILNGGTGTDTYTLRASDSGVDTIVDSDGLGSIKVIAADTSETTLGTGTIKKVAGTNNQWESEDKRFTYTTSQQSDGSATLLITGAGVTARVKNFSSGNLGITLPDAIAPETAPASSTTYDLATKDGYNHWYPSAAPGIAEANYKLLNAVQPAPLGTIFYSATNPTASWVAGLNGNDTLQGGATPAISQTVVRGNGGNDRMYAGVEQALQVAVEQGETLPGINSSNYLLDGGAGDDLLIGSAGDDVLFGGAGDDTLVGGAGNDLIISDGDVGSIYSAGGANWVTGSNNPLTGQARTLDIVHTGARLYLSPSDSTGQRTATYAQLAYQLDMTYDIDYQALRSLTGQDVRNKGYTYNDMLLDASTPIGSNVVHTSGVVGGAGDDTINSKVGDVYLEFNRYQYRSWSRRYLLGLGQIRHPKTPQKASLGVSVLSRRTRSGTQRTTNSIAACGRKQDGIGEFFNEERLFRCLSSRLMRQKQSAAVNLTTTQGDCK